MKMIDAHQAWLEGKFNKIMKQKQKHNNIFTPPPFLSDATPKRLTEEEVSDILRPKKQKKVKVRRRHIKYTFTRAEVDTIKTLVAAYAEELKKDSNGAECSRALQTLIDTACAMKHIDSSKTENRKQIKYQLLSCGHLKPTSHKQCTKQSIKVVTPSQSTNNDVPQVYSTEGLSASMNLEPVDNFPVTELAAKKSMRRAHYRQPRNVCSSGKSSRKKSGRPRRFRVAAGPRRSRSIFRTIFSRRARQQLREEHRQIYHSLMSDCIDPSAFMDADTRAKHQRLKDMEYFVEKSIGPKFILSMRSDHGIDPHSFPSCCGCDTCQCDGVLSRMLSRSNHKRHPRQAVLPYLFDVLRAIIGLMPYPMRLLLIFMFFPIVAGMPTGANDGTTGNAAIASAVSVAVAIGAASSAKKQVANPYVKKTASKRGRGKDKCARKKRPGLTEKQKKENKKQRQEKAKKEADENRPAETKKSNAAMRALFKMMEKGNGSEKDERGDTDTPVETGDIGMSGNVLDDTVIMETRAVKDAEDATGTLLMNECAGGANVDDIAIELPPEDLILADIENGEDNIEIFFENVMSDGNPPGVSANLDVEEETGCDVDQDDDDDGSMDGSVDIDSSPTPPPKNDASRPIGTQQKFTPTGVQQKFVCFVQRRIQYELSKDLKGLEQAWIMDHLRQNDWIITSARAPDIARRLNEWIVKSAKSPEMAKRLGLPVKKLLVDNAAYYRDVHVWLPDVRWGAALMPSCPTCKTNEDVGVHSFHDKHFGRLIVGLEENYYVISRRYLCRCCQSEKARLQESVETFANENNVAVNVEDVKFKYTFMGWNMKSLPLFADGRGDHFPAFLTWRAGVDKSLINLMRPLFDSGVRPEKFSDILLELHSKKHTERHLCHEREVARRKRLDSNTPSSMFSSFGDEEMYNGKVPTGRYLAHVYKQYHASIRLHLDNEVKKRRAETLHWDVSYKEAKNLCQYNGNPIFHGLVTALNEFGEVRIQFHVFSDGHDQMKTALRAFEKTKTEYGLPGVHLFLTDDPGRDKDFFPSMLGSLQDQQQLFDSQAVMNDATAPQLPDPIYNEKFTKTASGSTEIDDAISAMIATMGDHKVVGLDCEWKVLFRKRSIGGQDKVALLQISYQDAQGQMRVLVLQLYRLDKLPRLLESFLLDESIKIVGVNVSGDMRKIGRDFGMIEKMNRRVSRNVINLGKYARVRDVVQNGSVGLSKLCTIVLGLSLDKSSSVRYSDWTVKKLRNDQIKYAAIDALVSLQLYMELEKMPDLTRRLQSCDLSIGKRVDIVPRNGSVACMATRAASGVIIGMDVCESPVGLLPKRARCGQGHATVKIDTVYSSALQLPRYRVEATGDRATLGDCGNNHIILPLKMLRDHVENGTVRVTEVQTEKTGRTLPVTASSLIVGEVEGTTEVLECDEDEDAGPGVNDKEVDSYDLTTEDIERIRASFVESLETQSGRAPLQCKGLDEPPNVDEIVDKYCCVIGDVFHAMDRAKVPIKHEAKKGYFVALREAFFVWDQDMMNELEMCMRADGLSDEQIANARYYDKGLFTGCVARRVPPASILYWRVRAVYALYGKMIDSKTNKPLFNTRAWNKANNVLKDILMGYYSDPPGIEMYTKKLSDDGSIQKNKYRMEMIECMRGTNRTEAYHKNLVMTFGRWNTGVEMSTCLLSERRHRHNHRCSERRRFGFPRIGHYDTWLIDQLQNLVMLNHDTRLYPNWSNASDYRTTEESFDTIALHSSELHEALEDRFESGVDKAAVCLTTDQKYLCRSMGVPLPFLPFTTTEERKKFAECILTPDPDFPKDDEAAAIEWCKFVDGVNIFPKLPVHIRTYREHFQRNERVRQSVENAREGNQKLAELNEVLNSVTTELCRVISVPKPMPDPRPQALHQSPFVVVGAVAVGETEVTEPTRKPRTGDRKKRSARVCRSCCPKNGSQRGKFFEVCTGRASKGVCAFYKNGQPIPCALCVELGGGNEHICIAWSEATKKRDCQFFDRFGEPK